MFHGRIITVGVAPAWDVKCLCKSLGWGAHINIDEKTKTPAGKALNVSNALAWMGTKNIAAGLWGQQDYSTMLEYMKRYKSLVKINMTPALGCTRENIWVVDTQNQREIHLRSANSLATKKTLSLLGADLQKIIRKNDTLVFAGALPLESMPLLKKLSQQNISLVVDTSGKSLNEIMKLKSISLIKPNIDELQQLLGMKIQNNPASIKKHCEKLLSKVENILVSRSGAGAMLINKSGCWSARLIDSPYEVAGTVGCGDYLLAGFLAGMKEKQSFEDALKCAIISASARAFAIDDKSFEAVKRKLKISIEKI